MLIAALKSVQEAVDGTEEGSEEFDEEPEEGQDVTRYMSKFGKIDDAIVFLLSK